MYKSMDKKNHIIDPAIERNAFTAAPMTHALIPFACSFVTALLTQNLFIGGPSKKVGIKYENS
jgi:hypothetical protein